VLTTLAGNKTQFYSTPVPGTWTLSKTKIAKAILSFTLYNHVYQHYSNAQTKQTQKSIRPDISKIQKTLENSFQIFRFKNQLKISATQANWCFLLKIYKGEKRIKNSYNSRATTTV